MLQHMHAHTHTHTHTHTYTHTHTHTHIGKIEEPVPWRERLYDLVESEMFADSISIVIVVNTVFLGLQV